jgi:hypothetical protein
MRAIQLEATDVCDWKEFHSSFRALAKSDLGSPHSRAMTDLLLIQTIQKLRAQRSTD